MLDLERLMVLSEKATPGLWVRLRAAYADCLVVRVKDDDKGHDEEYLFSEEDQVFAAMARETMSDLILLATFAVNDLERAELERDQYDAAAEIFGRMVRRLQGQLDEAVDIAADREIERDTLAAKLREAEAREGELREARPEAARFAEEMENQLQANEEKGGWKDSDRRFLLSELTKNYNHLERLLVWFEGPGNVCRSTLISRESEKDILRRAANIANFAMMIADNFGGLMEGAYETLSRPVILSRMERMEKENTELRLELEEGDSWMERFENYIGDGHCPGCLAGDEEIFCHGHKKGCMVGALEQEKEELVNRVERMEKALRAILAEGELPTDAKGDASSFCDIMDIAEQALERSESDAS